MRLAALMFVSFAITIPFTTNADIKGKKKAPAKKKTELTDTYWRLCEMNGKKLEATGSNTDAYIYLKDKKDELIGFTGGNNISGEFEDGKYNAIGFEAVSTEKACPGIETETYLMDALKKANRYMINGENMLLYNDNVVLAIFEAK